MKIYYGAQEFLKVPHPVVTAGTFDGVHLGHQKIIRNLKNMADAQAGETVIITFWPHPKYVLRPDSTMKMLNTFEEKAGHLQSLGVDHLVRIPFTKAFSQMSSHQFLKDILVDQIGTKQLVIGYDHRFGKNREGSFEYLQANASQYGFEVVEISRKDVDHLAVSSTKIREHIATDQIHLANKLLGRFYEFSGTVIRGQQLGRKIGFPTANLEIAEAYKLIPSDGAYAVKLEVEGSILTGMMNIGVKPTIGEQPRSIEVHIFDFDDDLYGKQIRVEVVKQIRSETRFDDLSELTNQLQQDRKQARNMLNELKHP